jgi:dienelactone hydrolase
MKIQFRIIAAVAALLLAPAMAVAQSGDKVGVVFMHGKWAPGTRNLANLAQALQSAGYLVATPLMPWSAFANYNLSYDDAMAVIDAQVAALKSAGATRIAVGGQSLGANAAIGYGARHPGLMAIIAVSPGHIPDLNRDPQISDSIARAGAMVAAGRANDSDLFMDVNQGDKKMLRMSAAIYLSYWDPAGPAIIPKNVAKLSAPLLWMVGSEDPMSQRGQAYAFDKAPANPLSRYIVVPGGAHLTVVTSAGPQVVAWLTMVRDAKPASGN